MDKTPAFSLIRLVVARIPTLRSAIIGTLKGVKGEGGRGLYLLK